MSGIRVGVAGGLLLAALVTGTLVDVAPPRTVREMGGYQVLATDFHVHIFPFGWATLSPWDTVIEAQRQGLDAIAITPHRQVWAAYLGRWFSQLTGGPIVVIGEEITERKYHMIAAGITDPIPNALTAREAIAEIHRQGGVAIAAHPYGDTWLAYDETAMRTLDASEVVRPEAQHVERLASELRGFFARAKLTAIGSSDYHGLGPMGYTRTYVFARARTPEAVIEAVREGRTVVYGRDDVYGDAALIKLASDHGGLPHALPETPPPGAARVFSRLATFLALAFAVLFDPRRYFARGASSQ